MRTKTQIKRLQKWASELKALRPTKTKQFDMNVFRNTLYKHDDGIISDSLFDSDAPKECGFAGCAVGWLPKFFPHSFKMSEIDENSTREFFGLTDSEYSAIVYPENYEGHDEDDCEMQSSIKPREVAKRIEEVLNGEYDDHYCNCDLCESNNE